MVNRRGRGGKMDRLLRALNVSRCVKSKAEAWTIDSFVARFHEGVKTSFVRWNESLPPFSFFLATTALQLLQRIVEEQRLLSFMLATKSPFPLKCFSSLLFSRLPSLLLSRFQRANRVSSLHDSTILDLKTNTRGRKNRATWRKGAQGVTRPRSITSRNIALHPRNQRVSLEWSIFFNEFAPIGWQFPVSPLENTISLSTIRGCFAFIISSQGRDCPPPDYQCLIFKDLCL